MKKTFLGGTGVVELSGCGGFFLNEEKIVGDGGANWGFTRQGIDFGARRKGEERDSHR